MRPADLECPRVLCRRPLLCLLLLLLLLKAVIHARTIAGAPSASTALGTTSATTMPDDPSVPTTPSTPRAPRLRERAQALMRDFRLVDGCVEAAWGRWGLNSPLGQGRASCACRASEEAPAHLPWIHPLHHHSRALSPHYPVSGRTQAEPQRSPYLCELRRWSGTRPVQAY